MATRESIEKAQHYQKKVDDLEEFIKILKVYDHCNFDMQQKGILKIRTKKEYSVSGSGFFGFSPLGTGWKEKEINIPKEMIDFLLASATDLKQNYEDILSKL